MPRLGGNNEHVCETRKPLQVTIVMNKGPINAARRDRAVSRERDIIR